MALKSATPSSRPSAAGSGNEVEIYNPFNGPGAPEVKLDTVTIDAGLVNIGKVTSDSALNLNAVNVTAGQDINLASAADVSATASSFISTLGSFTINNGSASGNSTFGGNVTLSVSPITAGDSVSMFSYAGAGGRPAQRR